MKNKKFINILVMSSLIILPYLMKGQTPPIIDNNWVLNTSLSDEFLGPNLDMTKWDFCDNTGCFYPYVGGHDCWTNVGYFYSTNVSFRNGSLILTAQNQNSTAGIKSKNANYLYGYYEMRAKLPGFFDTTTQKHCSHGFWTAFWAYYHVTDANGCLIGHDEIDIVEPNGYEFQGENDAQTNEVGCNEVVTGSCSSLKYGTKVVHNLPPLYVDWHKFAAECLPDRIIYYFDDVPFNIVFGQPKYPTNLMKVVMDNQLQSTTFNPNTPWPMEYIIDYFRYYQLNTTYCGTDASIINNTQLASFQFGVRRNITIGNGSSTISLAAGDNKTFRATNGITINGDFTVSIRPTPS